MKGDDKAQIDARTTKLEEASQSLHAAAAAGPPAGDAADGGAHAHAGATPNDDVVDAEFTEVKDDKKA